MRRVRRAKLAGLDVEVVNHTFDSRHGTAEISSHAGLTIASKPATHVTELEQIVADRRLDLLAIDEAQFFGPDLLPAVVAFLNRGMNVAVAGLCVTYDARPFEPLPSLMAVAEEVVKLTAVCSMCGAEAPFHQRIHDAGIGDATNPVAEHVGGTETYQARCRTHLQLG